MSFITRFFALFRRSKLDRDMADEMRAHIELQAERNRAAGMSEVDARAAALRQFGGVAQVQEQARDARGWVWLDQFVQDLRHGVRLVRRNPGFTAAAVTVLALGIGANAAVFNLVRSLLFAPTTYVRPAEVRRVVSQNRANPRQTRDFSYPAYREIRDANAIFSGTLASASLVVGVGESGNTRRAAAAAVSANYFAVLGVTPSQGRAFMPEEETPGRATAVAIVSYNFWRNHHFDPALLGSTLSINTRPFTVVGIMPEGFTGTTALFFTEIWLPLGVYDQVAGGSSPEGRGSLTDPANTALMILGRLKAGRNAAGSTAALEALSANLADAFPLAAEDWQLALTPLSRFASPDNDTAVAWVGGLLLAMAAVVLLVACLNLANLLLARGTARRKEIALRLALGCGRGRIVRQLLSEGFLLALLGGVGGLVLALWSSSALTASLGRMIPIDLVWTADPDPALLAATFGFCVFSTLVFALGPALKLSRADALAFLKSHAGEDVVPRRWWFLPRNPLVSVQIALSLALLTAAALFMRSAARAGAAETGLQADRVFLAEIDAGLGGYSAHEALDIYRRLGERFAALPEVSSASVAADVPLSGQDLERKVRRPEAANDGGSAISAKWNGVGADYFTTAGLPLLRGRSFTDAEATQRDCPPVVIINELLARQLWPDGNALGERLQLLGDDAPAAGGIRTSSSESKPTADPIFEVIGIVPATRHALWEPRPDPALYLPFARGFQSHVFFHIKLNALPPGSEAATADLLRREMQEVDATLPVLSLKSFAEHLDNNIQIWIVRAGATLFAVFGGLALCLAVAGTYGVLAYSVARRTREIGIRMALGARPGTVLRMIFREGAVMLGCGLAVGLLLALGIGKVVSSLLYEVGALDPVAFTLAPGLLTLAAFVACWLPARRATRVPPMVALRSE